MQLSHLIIAALGGLAARVVAQDEVACGNNDYSTREIEAAASAACKHFERGSTAGSSSYPHRYNNYERFEFDDIRGPFQEFPIMSNGRVYTGGRPGPDRVIITEDCELAGQITHSGARGNAFVNCENAISIETQSQNNSNNNNNDSDDNSSSSNNNNNNGQGQNQDKTEDKKNDDDSGAGLVTTPGIMLFGVTGILVFKMLL